MAIFPNATIPSTSLLDLAPTDSAYGYLILLFIPVLTILGNILVILAVLGDKQLKKSVTNRYIAALAFSDFLVGVIPMPLAVYVKVNGEQWNLGVGLCKFYVACDVTSSTASILHLLVISADRYLAISWPAEYQRYARKAKITFAIVLVWLISITLSIPVVMGKSMLDTEACWLENPEYMIYSSLLSFYIPAGVLTLVYVKIFRKIRVRQGIHSMLRATGTPCGTDSTPFHLPFVVVQEVSFDDSAEKRHSDTVPPSVAAVDVNEPATTLPINSCPAPNKVDGRGYYQLVRADEEEFRHLRRATTALVTSSVAKSKTFPAALAEETETTFSLKDHCGQDKKPLRGRSLVPSDLERTNAEDRLGFGYSESRMGQWEKMEQRKDDGVRLLSRTASEKRPNEYKDRAVQTRQRRLSLWYHHSCQHVNITPNGNCFVIEDDELDEEHCPRSSPTVSPTTTTTTTGRRIFSRALGSSFVSLKQASIFRQKARRTSSLEPNPSPIPDRTQHLTVDPPGGVSVSTSIDFEAEFGSRRISSVQVDDEEDEDDLTPVYTLPSQSKTRPAPAGFNLKKLANRVTNALHRITETQAVTKEKKATKLVALILGIFVISWLPFFTFNTMRGICLSASSAESDCEWLNSHIFFLTSWLGYANSSFNPILYALVNQHFRRTYKKLLGWPLKRRN